MQMAATPYAQDGVCALNGNMACLRAARAHVCVYVCVCVFVWWSVVVAAVVWVVIVVAVELVVPHSRHHAILLCGYLAALQAITCGPTLRCWHRTAQPYSIFLQCQKQLPSHPAQCHIRRQRILRLMGLTPLQAHIGRHELALACATCPSQDRTLRLWADSVGNDMAPGRATHNLRWQARCALEHRPGRCEPARVEREQ